MNSLVLFYAFECVLHELTQCLLETISPVLLVLFWDEMHLKPVRTCTKGIKLPPSLSSINGHQILFTGTIQLFSLVHQNRSNDLKSKSIRFLRETLSPTIHLDSSKRLLGSRTKGKLLSICGGPFSQLRLLATRQFCLGDSQQRCQHLFIRHFGRIYFSCCM